jgi:hypothetical protein
MNIIAFTEVINLGEIPNFYYWGGLVVSHSANPLSHPKV